jgi:hypothetical protein
MFRFLICLLVSLNAQTAIANSSLGENASHAKHPKPKPAALVAHPDGSELPEAQSKETQVTDMSTPTPAPQRLPARQHDLPPQGLAVPAY